MNRKQFFKEDLPKLKALEVIEHDYTQQRFVDIFNHVHGDLTGEIVYETEKFYFAKVLQQEPKLLQCTPLSLFSVFLDIATKGLSLDDSSKSLCFITSRSVKIKTPDGDRWEQRALLDISGYGELVLRQRAGQVVYADNPEVVYNDELSSYKEENGPNGKQIFHDIEYPRPVDSGIALIYVRIVRPDKSVTFGTMDNEGIERLKNYSAMNNGKWEQGENGKYVNKPGQPNRLYGDLGFLKAKCLKHAFQSFPKLKLNNFSALTDGPEDPKELGISQQVMDDVERIAGVPVEQELQAETFENNLEAKQELNKELNPEPEEKPADGIIIPSGDGLF